MTVRTRDFGTNLRGLRRCSELREGRWNLAQKAAAGEPNSRRWETEPAREACVCLGARFCSFPKQQRPAAFRETDSSAGSRGGEKRGLVPLGDIPERARPQAPSANSAPLPAPQVTLRRQQQTIRRNRAARSLQKEHLFLSVSFY